MRRLAGRFIPRAVPSAANGSSSVAAACVSRGASCFSPNERSQQASLRGNRCRVACRIDSRNCRAENGPRHATQRQCHRARRRRYRDVPVVHGDLRSERLHGALLRRRLACAGAVPRTPAGGRAARSRHAGARRIRSRAAPARRPRSCRPSHRRRDRALGRARQRARMGSGFPRFPRQARAGFDALHAHAATRGRDPRRADR